MKITTEQVRHVADLANLALSDGEIERMAHDMDEILTHMDKLNELDTSTVEPMAQVLYAAEETATLREDRERPTLGTAEALKNAPVAAAGYFKVPKVIERG
jgi:aspartyl-tRNA(Asn)/glutamyl-tRNA(Gln) amidotransferase subunit C